jgi:hypothetical protein
VPVIQASLQAPQGGPSNGLPDTTPLRRQGGDRLFVRGSGQLLGGRDTMPNGHVCLRGTCVPPSPPHRGAVACGSSLPQLCNATGHIFADLAPRRGSTSQRLQRATLVWLHPFSAGRTRDAVQLSHDLGRQCQLSGGQVFAKVDDGRRARNQQDVGRSLQ